MEKVILNNRLGFILLLIAFIAFPLANTATRYILHNNIMPLEAYFAYVKVFSVLLIGLLGIYIFKTSFFVAKNKKYVAIRCFILVINNLTVTFSLSYLPLDIFYSIVFLMPLVTTVLAVIMLNEKFTTLNALAIILGFIGILIVIEPNISSKIGILGVITALAAIFTGSLSAIISRKHLQEENPLSANFYVAICSLITGVLMLYNGAGFSVFKQNLSLQASVVIFLSAFFTMVASYLYMKAFQISDAGYIAPAQYTQMIWAILFGYIIFNDTTTYTTMLGCVIIIIATFINTYKKVSKYVD